MATDKRDRQKEGHRARIEQARAIERRSRRTRTIGGAVAAVVVLLGFAVLVNATQDDTDGTVTASSDSASSDTTTTEVTMEEAVWEYGTTDCVKEGGKRTIEFEDGFKNCLKPDVVYTATMETTEGTIELKLDTERTPGTVNAFVNLARAGYYDGTELFRTDPSIAIIQGGSPHPNDASDQGPGPGFIYHDEGGEFASDGSVGPFTYEAGQIVVPRSNGPDAGGAGFFLTTGPEVASLDTPGTYVVFGTVTKGQDVLTKIMELHEPDDSGLGGHPSRKVTVTKVTITETPG